MATSDAKDEFNPDLFRASYDEFLAEQRVALDENEHDDLTPDEKRYMHATMDILAGMNAWLFSTLYGARPFITREQWTVSVDETPGDWRVVLVRSRKTGDVRSAFPINTTNSHRGVLQLRLLALWFPEQNIDGSGYWSKMENRLHDICTEHI